MQTLKNLGILAKFAEYSKSHFSAKISIYFEFYKPPHHRRALKMSKLMTNTKENQISFSCQIFEFDFFTPKFSYLDVKSPYLRSPLYFICQNSRKQKVIDEKCSYMSLV